MTLLVGIVITRIHSRLTAFDFTPVIHAALAVPRCSQTCQASMPLALACADRATGCPWPCLSRQLIDTAAACLTVMRAKELCLPVVIAREAMLLVASSRSARPVGIATAAAALGIDFSRCSSGSIGFCGSIAAALVLTVVVKAEERIPVA